MGWNSPETAHQDYRSWADGLSDSELAAGGRIPGLPPPRWFGEAAAENAFPSAQGFVGLLPIIQGTLPVRNHRLADCKSDFQRQLGLSLC
jgi:hypothetical protein